MGLFDWWEGSGLQQFVEEQKQNYQQLDQQLGGWLPLGYDAPQAPEPTYNAPEQFPGQQGIQTAFEQAGNETVDAPVWEGGHLTSAWGLRDSEVPGVAGVVRGAEVPLNILNQISERTWQPFFGAMEYENPGEVLKRQGSTDWWQEQQATMGSEKDLGFGRMLKGWEAMTGTPEQQEAGRQKFRELSTGQQLFGIATDPTNFIGLPGGLKPTVAKRAAEAAKAMKPIGELSRGERFWGGVVEGAADLPLEKMRAENPLGRIPVVGKLAQLTGKSKAAQDVASTQDQVVGRLAPVMREAAEDIEKTDLESVSRAVQEIILPTGKYGKSGQSFEANVARKVLAGFDPSSIVTKFNEGQAAIKELENMKALAAAGQAVDPTVYAKLEKLAAKAPKNKAEAIAQYGRDIIEHATKVTHKAYKVADKDVGVDKLINMQKNILASTLLALNPNYPVQNAVSNFTWSLLSGYSPFRTIGKSDDVLRQLGVIEGGLGPSRANAAMGMADVQAKGWQRLSAMGLAQKLEKIQGEGIWTQAFSKFMHQAKNKLMPQDIIGPQVRAALDAAQPGLSKWVDEVVRYGSDSPAAAIKKINGLPGFDKNAGLPRLINLLPDEFKQQGDMMATLERLGLNELDDTLDGAKNFDDVQRIIAEFKAKVAKVRTDAEAMGGGINAKADILDFIEQYTAKRSETFAKAAERRLAGGDPYGDLAVMFDDSRAELQTLVDGLKTKLAGGLDKKQLDAFEGTLRRWQDRTKAQQDEIAKIIAENKDNPQALKIAKDASARAYTADMKGIRSAANKQVTGLLETVYKVPEGKKAQLDAYWKKVLNPMPKEEKWMDEYLKAMVAAKDEAGEAAASAAFHAKRQKAWEKANADISRMGRELFGEAAEKAPTPAPKAVGWDMGLSPEQRTFWGDFWRKYQKDLDNVKPGDPKNESFLDFLFPIEYRDVQTSKPIFMSKNELPPVKDGYQRLYHGTYPEFLPSIDSKGVTSGAEAGLGEKVGEVLFSLEGREFGIVDVVVDLPKDAKELASGGRWWSLQRTVRPDEIVGYVPHRSVTKFENPNEYITLLTEWLGKKEGRLPSHRPPAPKAAEAVAKAVPVPDEGNAYRTLAQWNWGLLDKTLDDVLAQAGQVMGARTPGQVDALTRRKVLNAVQGLAPVFDDARMGAMRMANADRDFALLNYSHRYNFDHYLSLIMPFAFWQNTMAKNLAVRYLEQPGMFFAYSRYKEMLNEAEQDKSFPDRLRGMIRVSLPGAPEWMGDQFIDPLGRALPFNQMMYPFQAAQWEQEGEQGIGGMTQIMGSPSPLITTPLNLAGVKIPGLSRGSGKEVGALLPLTRQVKAATAMAREALPQLEKQIPAGGVNIEKDVLPIRQALRKIDPNVPDVDQWDEYRLERMLSDMAGNGEITAKQAKDAIDAKSGPIYERAVQKVGMEMGIGQLPGLAGAMTTKTYPTGEEKQRKDSFAKTDLLYSEASKAAGRPISDYSEAWKVLKEAGQSGDGSVMDTFAKEHPALAAKEYVSKDVFERQEARTWDELDEGSVSNKWKVANLTAEEQASLQKYYDDGYKVGKMTDAERAALKQTMAKIDAGRETDEFKWLAAMGKEVQNLINEQFALNGGPEGVTDKYGWLRDNKKNQVVAKWYADHQDYSNYGKGASGTTSGTTGGTTYSAKDPVLYAELQSLIDSEFARLGGPEGTANKYDWIKQANGGKTTSAIAKWYADHPGYSSGSSSKSTYTPRSYTPKAAPVYPEGVWPDAWKQFKKYAPELVKAASTYMQGGTISPDLVRMLYGAYQKMGITMRFDDWLRRLMKDSGLTKKAKKESKKNA